jgi:hypothetical protein
MTVVSAENAVTAKQRNAKERKHFFMRKPEANQNLRTCWGTP